MQSMVTYGDFKSMGLDFEPQWIRILVRRNKFPKPIAGAGIDGRKPSGRNAKFHWSRKDFEQYIATKKPRQV